MRRVKRTGLLALAGGLLLVIGAASTGEARKLVQGPGGCVYEAVEYTIPAVERPSVRIGYAAGGNARRSILIEATCARTGETRFIVPPGVRPGGDDSSPGLDVDALSGALVLIWEHRDAGASDVYLAEFDGARWSGPVVLTNDSVDNRDPSFVVDALGRVHLVWWEDEIPGGIRYARIEPENRRIDFSVVGTLVDLSSEDLTGNGSGEQQPSLGGRFPFLAYDAKTDLVYLAFESPSEQSITVLWFETGKPPDSKGGGQAIVPVVLVTGGPGVDQKRSVAARPTVFSCREATVVFWWQGPVQIAYVYFLANRPGLGPTEVFRADVREGISREQAQNLVFARVYRDLHGSGARDEGLREAVERGIR